MQISTKAIVISKIKYNDYDLIVKCYTQLFGIKTYLIKNALKTKKGKFKPAYFQLFSILEIDAVHKDNRAFQYLRDVKLSIPLDTLYTSVIKSSIVMFLAEILSTVLKEEEERLELYDFLESSIIWFDSHKNYASFHLIFLIELTKYLGFYPDKNDLDSPFFDLQEGKFQKTEQSPYCVSGENLTFFKQLLGTKFDVDKKLRFNTNQKREVLNMILSYFKLHLGGFKEPKSLAVLNQVYR